jgi:MFS family permease
MLQRPVIVAASIILAVSFLVMLLAYGVRHSFPVFFPFILDEYGWTRGDTALMFSLHLLVYGICAPIVGSLVSKLPAKTLLLFGIVILGLAAAACSYATRLWHFYILFGALAPVGLACTGSPVLNPTIMNWFAERRGMALGLAQTGGGLSFVFVFLMEFIIEGFGWRVAYVIMGLLTVAVLLPIVLLGYTFSPKERGLRAIGSHGKISDTNDTPSAKSDQANTERWTRVSGLRSRPLWLLFVSNMLFWGTGCYLILAHQVKFAIDAGYSPAVAASTTAAFGIFMVIGQASSFISDYIGREATIFVASVFTCVATVILMFLEPGAGLLPLYSFSVLFGLGAGLFAVCVFVGVADIFFGRDFGLFCGIVTGGMGLGGAFGPWLGGVLFDVSGSYHYSFLFAALSFLISFVCFFLAAPRRYTALNRFRTKSS